VLRVNTIPNAAGEEFIILGSRPSWKLWICEGFFIQFDEANEHTPPCRFHRWMQRLVFGFRWEKP
jgi:hypothetical protein